MKRLILFSTMCLVAIASTAHETHVIEPSILQVRYEVTHEKDKDMFALRCGKNVSKHGTKNRGKVSEKRLKSSKKRTFFEN
ncbi:MAG: hypothetical protein K6B45_09500 [Bacteroidaceae bacterium]|nr:hypothetical protein [Bacteroidaceae bacterium]